MKTISLLFSWTAIILSIVALVGKTAVTAEGGVLTIVSICVTLIVGVSVVDSLTVHNIQKRIDKLSEEIKKIEEKEKDLENEREKQKASLYISNQVSWGMATLNGLPYTSFRYFVKGLEKSLEANNQKGINSCLKCMEQVPKVIERMKKKGEECDDAGKKKELPAISDIVKELEVYKLVKSRIEKIFEQMKGYYL